MIGQQQTYTTEEQTVIDGNSQFSALVCHLIHMYVEMDEVSTNFVYMFAALHPSAPMAELINQHELPVAQAPALNNPNEAQTEIPQLD